MIKEVIKKNKKAFEAWLDGDTICMKSENDSDDNWTELSENDSRLFIPGYIYKPCSDNEFDDMLTGFVRIKNKNNEDRYKNIGVIVAKKKKWYIIDTVCGTLTLMPHEFESYVPEPGDTILIGAQTKETKEQSVTPAIVDKVVEKKDDTIEVSFKYINEKITAYKYSFIPAVTLFIKVK